MDVAALNNRLKLAERAMIESTTNNYNEFTKFFKSIWEIEKHQYAPLKVSEVFPGLNIPNPSIPEQDLKVLYPHYLVRVFDVKDPEYSSHLPGSAEFMHEQDELVALVKQIRDIVAKFNERMMAECELQFGGQH